MKNYRCIESVIMEDGWIAYLKGKTYRTSRSRTITTHEDEINLQDEQNCEHHWETSDPDFQECFIEVDDMGNPVNEEDMDKNVEYDEVQDEYVAVINAYILGSFDYFDNWVKNSSKSELGIMILKVIEMYGSDTAVEILTYICKYHR